MRSLYTKAMAAKYTNVAFFLVNVDSNSETAEKCGIESMPTFKYYKNGTEVDSLEGASEKGLEDKIKSNHKVMARVLKTKADFDEVLAGNPGKLVVVDFFATWCGPCKAIAPFFESLSGKYPEVVFCKVDVDGNEATAEECGIESMPTFKLYKDGNQVNTLEGADKGELEKMVVRYK